jgi:regulator of protease activity HflC (stomatin/prohibitin superfamily)
MQKFSIGPGAPGLFRTHRRKILIAGLAVFGLLAANSAFFTVDPSEMAGVRTFGYTPTTPVGPGPHVKLPFFSSVDRVQVSLTQVPLEPFEVGTVDNQVVTLGDVTINYVVPHDAVLHLLYNVGKAGDADITHSIIKVAEDQIGRVVSSKNTNVINATREAIQEEITRHVARALKDQYHIDVHSIQIPKIKFSDAFVTSNNNAVLEKNAAVAAENRVRTIELEARQKVAQANGARDVVIAGAEGENRSKILQAEAKAQSIRLEAEAAANAKRVEAEAEAAARRTLAAADKEAIAERGVGEAAARKAMVEALGGSDRFVQVLNAQALNRWKGDGSMVPQIVTSDKASSMMPLLFNSVPVAGK